jgi:hypothetical protein
VHSISAYMMLLTMDVLIAESSCYIYISVDYNGRHAISYLPNKNAKWPINFILNGHFDRSNKLKHITWMVLFKKHNSKRRNTNIFLALPWQSTKSCYKFMVPDHCQYQTCRTFENSIRGTNSWTDICQTQAKLLQSTLIYIAHHVFIFVNNLSW